MCDDKVLFRLQLLLITCLLSYIYSANADAPYINPSEDYKHFGSPYNVLFWTPEEQVAGYRNSDKIFWTRTINAGDTVHSLPYAKVDLGDVEIKLNGATMTVNEYFARQSVAGLLVIKDGKILYERYGLGNTEDSKWISFSVAKSVVSMLIGAAIQDGYIKSVHEKVTNYLPRLKGSSYGQSSIANLLQMASGVQWNEDYADPQSDVATASWKDDDLYKFLQHKARDARPGVNSITILRKQILRGRYCVLLLETIFLPTYQKKSGSHLEWNLMAHGILLRTAAVNMVGAVSTRRCEITAVSGYLL